jgi:hypothetical protein
MSSILDHQSISRRDLFPQNRPWKFTFVVRVNNIELACYQKIHDASRFTLIHFHGNGEEVSDDVPFVADVFEHWRLGNRALQGCLSRAELLISTNDFWHKPIQMHERGIRKIPHC